MGEQKDKMLAGELFLGDDPELTEERRRCRLLLERFNATSFAEQPLRDELLRELLREVGDGSEIATPFQCEYGYNIRLGERVRVSQGATILDWATVEIGDDVHVGPGAKLLAGSRPLDPDQRRAGFQFAKPVRIGGGAWIAAGALIGPGVSVGEDSVVGAGSVVVHDVPPLVVVAGNPAHVLRHL